MTLQRFTEATYDASFQIDEEAGIVRNVKVLGLNSANGRTYLQEAVDSASELFEGAATYLNHDRSGAEREVNDANGWLRDIRSDAAGGSRADWHYLKTEPQNAKILEAARRNPALFGFSIDASGEIDSGKVTKITKVHSVDVVTRPATTKSLFESKELPMKKTIAKILESTKRTKHPLTVALQEMCNTDKAMMEMEVEVSDEGDGVEQGLMDAVMAKLKDASPDTLKKVMMMLGGGEVQESEEIKRLGAELKEAQESLKKSDSASESAAGDAVLQAKIEALTESVKVLETQNVKLQSERDEIALRDTCRQLLESSGREARDVWVASLMKLNESERASLIESLPREFGGGPRPNQTAQKLSGVELLEQIRKS